MPNSAGTRGNLYVRTYNSSGQLTSTTVSSAHFSYRWDDKYQDTVRRTRPTDLFASGTSRSHSSYTVRQTDNVVVTRGGGAYDTYPQGNFLSYTPLAIRMAATDCDGRIRAKIKSSNLNLAQSCAEYRQTCSMFGGLVRDLHKGFTSLRNGRAYAEFVRILRSPRSTNERRLANRWLEYQYGLKPLMSDLYGAVDAMSTKLRTGFPQYVYSRLEQEEFVKRQHGAPFASSYSMSRVNTSVSAKARYTIRHAALKQMTQLGITNPLLLAWELIPYSFVVDWAFPVGNYLESLDALNGVSGLLVVRTHRQTEVLNGGCGGGSLSMNYRYYSRSAPTSSLALPKLGYKPSSSLTAVLNGLALLKQLRR